MNGTEMLVDTNIILHLLKGSESLSNALQGKQIYISFITESELLGYKGITSAHEHQILELLDDCIIVHMTQGIKSTCLQLSRKYKIKLPDAIIASPAVALELPLTSEDKGFQKIAELDLPVYERS